MVSVTKNNKSKRGQTTMNSSNKKTGRTLSRAPWKIQWTPIKNCWKQSMEILAYHKNQCKNLWTMEENNRKTNENHWNSMKTTWKPMKTIEQSMKTTYKNPIKTNENIENRWTPLGNGGKQTESQWNHLKKMNTMEKPMKTSEISMKTIGTPLYIVKINEHHWKVEENNRTNVSNIDKDHRKTSTNQWTPLKNGWGQPQAPQKIAKSIPRPFHSCQAFHSISCTKRVKMKRPGSCVDVAQSGCFWIHTRYDRMRVLSTSIGWWF